MASFDILLSAGPQKYRTYTEATTPNDTNPNIANAHLVLRFSNMRIPIKYQPTKKKREKILSRGPKDIRPTG